MRNIHRTFSIAFLRSRLGFELRLFRFNTGLVLEQEFEFGLDLS